MTLRVRLTLIYGGLLAVLFIGLGFGAQAIVRGHFEDESRLQLSAAAQEFKDGTIFDRQGNQWIPQWPPSQEFNPFKNPGLYLEVIDNSGSVTFRSPSLGLEAIPVPPGIKERVISSRVSEFGSTMLTGTP